MVDIQSCSYLNKFTTMAQNDLLNPSLLSPVDLKTATVATENLTEASHSPSRFFESTKSKNRSSAKSNVQGLAKKVGLVDIGSVLMDAETKRYVNEYKNQIDYLKSIIFSLDLKLQNNTTQLEEMAILKDEVSKANNSREELRSGLMESTGELRSETQKFKGVISELTNANKHTLECVKQKNSEIEALNSKLGVLEIKFSSLENDNSELRLKLKN
jgi:hypothetical protein